MAKFTPEAWCDYYIERPHIFRQHYDQAVEHFRQAGRELPEGPEFRRPAA